MTDVASATPCAKSDGVRKYERRISKASLIRRFARGDQTVTNAALQYLSRFTSERGSLWVQDDGSEWIAQPLRCFAEELDLPLRTLTQMHDRMVSLGMFEVTAQKLYAGALRNTTHVRPTPLFRLYLHDLGWWEASPAEAAALRLQYGQELATLAVDRQCTYAVDRTLMESDGEGTQISPCGSDLPAAPQPGVEQAPAQAEVQCSQLQQEEAKVVPMAPDKSFKGGTVPSSLKKKPAQPTTVLQAAQAVIEKKHLPPSAFPGSGGPAKTTGAGALWAKAAVMVRQATGDPFPMKAPAAAMARLAQMRKSMAEEFEKGDDPFWDTLAAAVGDWGSFREWMLANSSMATPKKTPETVDVLWLQFHRHKAYEYARGPGKDLAASVRAGKKAEPPQAAPTPTGPLSVSKKPKADLGSVFKVID